MVNRSGPRKTITSHSDGAGAAQMNGVASYLGLPEEGLLPFAQ